MAAREPRSRNSRRGSRRASRDLAEVAMQVAQAGFDGELSDAEHQQTPILEKFGGEAPVKPTMIESMQAAASSGVKLDPADLLLRLPTPSRSMASKAMLQLPSPPPSAPAPTAAPLSEPLMQAHMQPPTAPPTQPPAEAAAASFKGPEPWNMQPGDAALLAAQKGGGGSYRDFLQARGQHAMHRSSQMPPLPMGARFPGQAVPPPPAMPAPGVGGFLSAAPAQQMQQCYAAEMSPMSQMSPISPSWYGAQSFEMPLSPMMHQFSPCMQQQAGVGTPHAMMGQGQSAFMMPQQGYMTPTGCQQAVPQQPPPAQGEQQWGQEQLRQAVVQQQPAQGEQQWGQDQLQALLMPEASYMDRSQVILQLRAAAEAAGAYED